MRTFEALFSVFARLFLILEKGVAIAVAILVIVWSPWNARADFHVMLRTSLVDGAAADNDVVSTDCDDNDDDFDNENCFINS